jgi:hypothetical protein
VLGRSGPDGFDVGERRKWSFPVHRRDSPIEAQRICLGREAAFSEYRLERPELAEQVSGPLLPDAARTRYPIGRIAAQGDEVGYLRGIDPVALANLGRADAGRRSSAHGLEDGRRRARKLKGVAV